MNKLLSELRKLLKHPLLRERKTLLAAYLLVLLLGAGAAVVQTAAREFPAQPPESFSFEATLADPYDPFRGRYLALVPLPEEVTLPAEKAGPEAGDCYALLSRNKAGFAEITALVKRPREGETSLKVRVLPNKTATKKPESKSPFITRKIKLPFDRWYMNEKLAPKAEAAIRKAAEKGRGKCVLRVKIYKNGTAEIQTIEIDGKPLKELL